MHTVSKYRVYIKIGFGVLENFNKAFKAADKFEETELVSLSICPHALSVSHVISGKSSA